MLHLLYLLSGVAGLLYEIVWLRLLSLELGHTTGAVGTVLAAFMGGLAAGAAAGGRWIARAPQADAESARRALRVYAALEIVVAVSALALPFLLSALGPALAAAYGESGGAAFAALRIGLCLLLVAVPAAAMGATYPIAVAAAPARAEGTLYAANTVGAAAGAAVTGFLLLPAAGMWRTTLLGAAINVLVAILALRLAGRVGESARPSQRPRERERAGTTVPLPIHRAAAVLFTTGFIALVSEVAWTRVFAMIIGPTTYAFTVMLVAFIGGLAAGAAAGARLAARVARPALYLVACLALVAAGTAAGIAWIETLPLTVGRWVAAPDARFGAVLAAEAALCAGLLLPMTFALGAAFPLALAWSARTPARSNTGKRSKQAPVPPPDLQGERAGAAGWLFAANTAGAITGSLAGAFAIVPALGLRGTLMLAAALALAAGSALAWSAARTTRGRIGAAAIAAAIAGLATLPQWNPSVLTGGAYKYAPYMRRLELREALEAGTLAYYEEGTAGTVSVRRTAGRLSLSIDGKIDASNGGDMLTQKLLAHLPLLAHAGPRRAAIIGLGSGVTAGSALRHPLERLTVVEISPEVVEASRLFDADSGAPLQDGRTRLIVGDARTHFALSSERYDVIVSEPSNPWMAGVAALFTREFFERARDRLAPGGFICQWTHTYDIREQDLRSIVATFAAVFPSASAWLIGDGDLLLLGSVSDADDHGARIAASFNRPGVAADLATVGITGPFSVLSLFAGGRRAVAELGSGAEIQRDDRLELEFSGPRSIIGATPTDNARVIRTRLQAGDAPGSVAAALAAARAEDWTDRGRMLLAIGAPSAMEDFVRAVQLGDTRALDGLRRAAVASGRIGDAVAALERMPRTGSAASRIEVEISRLRAAEGDLGRAMAAAEAVLRTDPSNAGALIQVASLHADAGDADALARTLPALRTAAPDAVDTPYYEGVLAFMRQDFAAAARFAGVTIERDRSHDRALTLSGAAYASLGDVERARRAFEAAIAAMPGDPAPYVNLGELELRAGRADAASKWFTEALALDPESAAARQGLATTLDLRGERARAARLRAR